MTVFQMKLLKYLMVPFSRWNARRYLKSNGKICDKLFDVDLCIATIQGAKTNKIYNVPLIHIPYKNGVILVASQGGAPHHPQWYFNLLKNPTVIIQVKDKMTVLNARLATKDERGWLWPLCIVTYPGYQHYQNRTKREIPLFICEPLD